MDKEWNLISSLLANTKLEFDKENGVVWVGESTPKPNTFAYYASRVIVVFFNQNWNLFNRIYANIFQFLFLRKSPQICIHKILSEALYLPVKFSPIGLHHFEFQYLSHVPILHLFYVNEDH